MVSTTTTTTDNNKALVGFDTLEINLVVAGMEFTIYKHTKKGIKDSCSYTYCSQPKLAFKFHFWHKNKNSISDCQKKDEFYFTVPHMIDSRDISKLSTPLFQITFTCDHDNYHYLLSNTTG